MSKHLFDDYEHNAAWQVIIKTYFDVMYSDGLFIKAAAHIIDKRGFSTDGAYCNFPDANSDCDDELFEGVEFACGYPPEEDDTVIVSEEICYNFIRLACEKYLRLHGDDAEVISEILAKLPD